MARERKRIKKEEGQRKLESKKETKTSFQAPRLLTGTYALVWISGRSHEESRKYMTKNGIIIGYGPEKVREGRELGSYIRFSNIRGVPTAAEMGNSLYMLRPKEPASQ